MLISLLKTTRNIPKIVGDNPAIIVLFSLCCCVCGEKQPANNQKFLAKNNQFLSRVVAFALAAKNNAKLTRNRQQETTKDCPASALLRLRRKTSRNQPKIARRDPRRSSRCGVLLVAKNNPKPVPIVRHLRCCCVYR